MASDDRFVTLRLFGSPGIFGPGDPTSDGGSALGASINIGRRARGMLGYLVVGQRRASRERLLGLFWPDRGEAQARASLRQCLVELRAALGDALATDREWVALDPEALTGDWRAIDEALADDDPAALTDAIAAIGAEPLLDGLEFGEAFDDWLRGARTALDSRLAAAAMRGIAMAQASGDTATALVLADAWLIRDPRDEAVVAAAIGIEIARHAPAAARKRYRAWSAYSQSKLARPDRL